MPNIGPLELAIVLLVVLVIFGPKRLPGLGRSVGKGMREFKDSVSGLVDRDDGDEDEDESEDGPEAVLVAGEPVADDEPETAADTETETETEQERAGSVS